MNKIFIPMVFAVFLLSVSNVQAESLFDVYLDANDTTVSSMMAFHESSKSITWYIRTHQIDVTSFDNHTVNFDCGGSVVGSFSTKDYETWNTFGFIEVGLDYETDPYSISYNEIGFTADYLRCEFTVNSGSFLNNSAYDYITMELIPVQSSIEFINCEGVTSSQIAVAEELEMFVSMASDFWSIVWLIFSIFAIVFAVTGIPAFVFMLIRYVIFRITGHKIGGGAEQ